MITPPVVVAGHPYWASELVFSKTAGRKYCKDYPDTISRCMAHYTKSFTARYSVMTTETETEVEYIKLYPGHTMTQTEVEIETEMKNIKTTVVSFQDLADL